MKSVARRFALVLLFASGAGVAVAADTQEPLTESEIVRMVAAGRSDEEILDVIAKRPAAFDLSSEMVDELRSAGVSDALIQAMARRQRETTPPPPKAAAVEAIPDLIPVRVMVTSGAANGINALFIPDLAWDALAKTLQLGARPEDRRVRDLAIFLACLAKDHVPGLWRSSSPLGRDFVSIPPHQLLGFQAGARSVSEQDVPAKVRSEFDERNGRDPPPRGWLRLDLPAALTADLEKSGSHDLLLGVAALVGDNYLCVGSGGANGITSAGPTAFAGSIQGGGGRGPLFDVRLVPEKSP